MGGMLSRRRDSYIQTSPDEYRKTYIEKPLERGTTFNDKPTRARLSVRSVKSRQKRQKRDSTSSLSNPRTILPIKEENIASQKMTDAATDQHTPKGFPFYTELNI